MQLGLHGTNTDTETVWTNKEDMGTYALLGTQFSARTHLNTAKTAQL